MADLTPARTRSDETNYPFEAFKSFQETSRTVLGLSSALFAALAGFVANSTGQQFDFTLPLVLFGFSILAAIFLLSYGVVVIREGTATIMRWDVLLPFIVTIATFVIALVLASLEFLAR